MKRKTFKKYLKTRLNENEIAEIKEQALQEKNALQNMTTNKHLGSRFDDYLKEEGILEEVTLEAMKMVITNQIAKKKKKTKDYEKSLLEALKDPKEALAYFNAALTDEDEKVFFLALKHVLKAQGLDIFTNFK